MSGLAYLAGGLLQGTGKGMQENAATRIEEEVAKARAMQQENYAIKLNDMAVQRDKVNNELADTRQKSQNDFTRQMAEDQNVWKSANDDKNYARDVAENDRAFQRSKSLIRPSEGDKERAELKRMLDAKEITPEEYKNKVLGLQVVSGGDNKEKKLYLEALDKYSKLYENDMSLSDEEKQSMAESKAMEVSGYSPSGRQSAPVDMDFLKVAATELYKLSPDERPDAFQKFADQKGPEAAQELAKIYVDQGNKRGLLPNNSIEATRAKQASQEKSEEINKMQQKIATGEIPPDVRNMSERQKANFQKIATARGMTLEQVILEYQRRHKENSRIR